MRLLDNLWGVLPLATYVGLVAGQMRRGQVAAEALLRAAVGWAAGVWMLTNALGLFDALRPGSLRVAWSLLATAALVDGFRRWAESVADVACGPAETNEPVGTERALRSTRSSFEWAAGFGIGALLLLALGTAVLAPPVTVDVLNYHLPRQLMWLQQGSLAHYLTVNDRELMMPPLAEVIGMQWLALTGDDRWANLPQWFAYALLPVAVLSAARAFGLSRGAAALAAWLAVCLPMAWHEASNGKNDLQGALWLTLLLGQVARARAVATPPSRGDALLTGVTLALAVLTKSTALIFAPLLLAAGWLAWRRTAPTGAEPASATGAKAAHCGPPSQAHRRRAAWRATTLAALASAALTAPFFARNFAWYGTPLGVHRAEDGGGQTNDAATPALIASNALRNAALHLSLPSPAWNAALDRAERAAHGALGVSPDDPRSTLWTPVLKFAVTWEPSAETVAGAPAHFVLIALALLAVWWRREWRAWQWLAAVTAVMALLYCAALKWQPWGARLQLPGFVTGTLLVAALADALATARRRHVVAWTVGMLGLLAWWPSHETSARPLWTVPTLGEVPRETNYYRYNPDFLARDTALAAMVRTAAVREVALVAQHDSAYPLMRRLQREVPVLRFYGAPIAQSAPAPAAILVLELGAPLALFYDWPGGARYRLTGAGAGDGLYLPEAQVRALGWERRLPAFAGWTSQQNFTLRAVGADGLTATRVMAGATATVSFPGWEGRVRLSGTLQKSTATPEGLEFAINGMPASRVEFRAAPGRHEFEVTLPCRPGINLVELRRPGTTDAELVFTRLTVDDGTGKP